MELDTKLFHGGPLTDLHTGSSSVPTYLSSLYLSSEGIILDPVYTGKSMYGLYCEIKNGKLQESQNILFIHTGGIFGWTDEKINMLYGAI